MHRNWHRAHNKKGNSKPRHLKDSPWKAERQRAKRRNALAKADRRERRERRHRVVSEYGLGALRGCASKVRFDGVDDAERYATLCGVRYGVPTYTYRCDKCGGWHLTTHPRE